MSESGNGQTTRVGSSGKTDPTALTTDALMREVAILNQDIDRRFEFYDRLLADADKLRLEQKTDSKEAVSSALAAAKEAVKEQNMANKEAIGKSESMQQTTIDIIKMDIIDLKTYKAASAGVTAAMFVSQEAYKAAHDPLVRDIEDLKLSRERDRGKQLATTTAVGVIFAIISLAMRFL